MGGVVIPPQGDDHPLVFLIPLLIAVGAALHRAYANAIG